MGIAVFIQIHIHLIDSRSHVSIVAVGDVLVVDIIKRASSIGVKVKFATVLTQGVAKINMLTVRLNHMKVDILRRVK